jgi:hypothetical protein
LLFCWFCCCCCLSSVCVLCTKYCHCFWIFHSLLHPSVFSNVYLQLPRQPNSNIKARLKEVVQLCFKHTNNTFSSKCLSDWLITYLKCLVDILFMSYEYLAPISRPMGRWGRIKHVNIFTFQLPNLHFH